MKSTLVLVSALVGLSVTQAQNLVDFDVTPSGVSIPHLGAITTQWESLGVRFAYADSLGAVYASGNSCSYSQPNHVGASPYFLAFFVDPDTGAPAAVDYVGTRQDNCWYPGEGIGLETYDIHGNLLDSGFNSVPGGLLAFSYEEPIVSMLKMSCVGQGVDDLEFSVPVALACPRVTDLQIELTNEALLLQWSPVAEADVYRILCDTGSGEWVECDTVLTCEWALALPDPPRLQLFQVLAICYQ